MKFAGMIIAFIAGALAPLAAFSKSGKAEFPENVVHVKVPSPSMKKDVDALVVLPKSYAKSPDRRYPVVYLLHGFSGNYTTWAIKTKPDLNKIASKRNVIFVCPDGGNSWYIDSPVIPDSKYETFTASELVEFVDKNYRTVASKRGRAIAGLSMGGHGALFLCFRHQDTFGACGSMSGTLDLRMNVNDGKIAVLGEYSKNRGAWDEHSVANNLHLLCRKNMPAVIIDCGTEDHLFPESEKVHREMLGMRLPHEYITRPGAHKRPYWNDAIDAQILFFVKYFNSK